MIRSTAEGIPQTHSVRRYNSEPMRASGAMKRPRLKFCASTEEPPDAVRRPHMPAPIATEPRACRWIGNEEHVRHKQPVMMISAESQVLNLGLNRKTASHVRPRRSANGKMDLRGIIRERRAPDRSAHIYKSLADAENARPQRAYDSPHNPETVSGLDLRLGRWKVASFALRAESLPAMRSIAERLIFGHSATAKRDNLPPGKAEIGSFEVLNLKVPFDANGTVS